MRRLLLRTVVWVALAVAAFYALAAVGLLYLRFFDPLTTAVQMQRRLGAWVTWSEYDKRSEMVPLSSISLNLQHAVIAAEDSRFYQHSGFDWTEIERVVEQSRRKGRVTRGASTITQQLVKNLFLTDRSWWVRKALEIPLTWMAEVILPKQRILELYLNVVEWGPGVWGAEAAAEYHYGTGAAGLTRAQAARLAAVLPAPRRRKPSQMNSYANVILRRMAAMGW